MASDYRQHKESNITGFVWFWRIVQNLWAFKCSGFPEFRIKKQIHLIHDEPGMTHEWKNNHAGAYELTRTQSVHNRRVPYLLFSQPEKRWKSICNVSSSNPSRSVDSVDQVNPLDQPRAHADGNSQAARQQWQFSKIVKYVRLSNPKHRRSQKLHHPLLITTVPSTTRWKICRFWRIFAWKL